MTDHIVVFDGNPRLVGQTIAITIHEASPFTLFGRVETDEIVGAASGVIDCEIDAAVPANDAGRIGLPLV